jgi:hypothetical protein
MKSMTWPSSRPGCRRALAEAGVVVVGVAVVVGRRSGASAREVFLCVCVSDDKDKKNEKEKHGAPSMALPAGFNAFLIVIAVVFAGVGLVALPADLIRAWAGRPRATIPWSEYARWAGLGARAGAAELLRAEERGGGGGGGGGKRRGGGRGRPLSRPRCARCAARSTPWKPNHRPWKPWVVHLSLAAFPRPPLSPALSAALAGLDRAAPLLGTVAFAGLCTDLVAATLAGCAAAEQGGGRGGVAPTRAGWHARVRPPL